MRVVEGSYRSIVILLLVNVGPSKAKSRLASSSSKGRNGRKSDNLEDNPYTSGLENNTQVAIGEDDESNMINISTKENLNKTEAGLLYLS
jgi:hypothetical protein